MSGRSPPSLDPVGVPVETSSAAEVLLATGHDPFARGVLRAALVRGWVRDGAVLWLGVDPEEKRSYLSGLGEPPAVAALVADLLPELPHRQRVTLPRGTAPLLPAWVGVDGVDWDFRCTYEAPPVQPGEDDVVELADVVGVAELLEASSPRASTRPGDDGVRRWVGVRDGGRLVACAADTSGAPGVGHLSSIAVHPDCQGRGLGGAVTARLTRVLMDEGCDLVTLGTYADNAPARAVYDRLGFRDEHRFTSGPLQVRSRW
ncbi:MAG: GCN5-related N-acetyltransferase [Frankiales bacterium]|nr:GCN5-related N-acetyltransferase [Frankiales bacterium]